MNVLNFLSFLVFVAPPIRASGCGGNWTAFELVTGFVFASPDPNHLLDNRPGTLFLRDCLDACRLNSTCQSANFETGLCVLFTFSSDTDKGLQTSQFPVFTMYGQKVCVKGSHKCSEYGWAYERVPGYALVGYSRKTQRATSRFACFELCLKETDFTCRSVNFNADSGECALSDADRFAASAVPGSFVRTEGNRTDYMENNCLPEMVKMCDFVKTDGKILKTVDSLIQNVTSLDECRKKCLAGGGGGGGSTRCRTFDWGVTGEDVCRLSHHAASTLTNVREPYLEAPGTSSFELSSCYDVSVKCRAGDMVADVVTNKVFDGKIYAKKRPLTCVYDVVSALTFRLLMPYDDARCGVERRDAATFANDIVLQHHDAVVTNLDVGMSVRCRYDLQDKSVANAANLSVHGDVGNSASESATVSSPNVVMKVTDRGGDDVTAASVGDPLSLRFFVDDADSPYEIFVRELIAQDGAGGEILLVDSLGCPTDGSIMGPLTKADGGGGGKTLAAPFDAFKFPSTEVVQFKALVTPCLPTCAPAKCEVRGVDGTVKATESYGRRRRRQIEAPEVVVVQRIRITDRSLSDRRGRNAFWGEDYNLTTGDADAVTPEERAALLCPNVAAIFAGCAAFVFVQILVLIAWVLCVGRRRTSSSKGRTPT